MKDKISHTILLSAVFLILLAAPIFSQNTVGLIDLEKDEFGEGYNLFYSHNQSTVFLIDNCGQIVHTWEDEAGFRPGNMAYLLEDGTLVRCKRPNNPTMDSIWAGGGGAFIDIVDWEGNILHQFFQNDSLRRVHHDIAVLPNGNVLAISWELKTGAEAIQAGRDSSTLVQNKLWPDYILELTPELDSVVWEWHVWDHLIQEFDPSKENFGVVGDHPELIDINWQTNDGFPDWMHSNALDYNDELDQILLCVPAFNEVWIIDHSTTTEEAKGHTGGNSGKGGDLLFRWGNPQTYRAAGEQQLFWPHDAHWVDQFLEATHPDYGKLAVFNNRVGPNYSSVQLIQPLMDMATKDYQTSIEGTYLPDVFDLTLLHPDTFDIHSTGLSSVQVLANENLLICSGRWGRVFEINPSSNEVVWEYRVPLKGGSPVAQGTELVVNNNLTFRFTRYPVDYAGFGDRILSPQGYLELEPNLEWCDLLTPTEEILLEGITLFPNPASGRLNIRFEDGKEHLIQLHDTAGRTILSQQSDKEESMDISNIESGIYIVSIDGRYSYKVVIH